MSVVQDVVEVSGVQDVVVCQLYKLSLCVRCTRCHSVSGVQYYDECQAYKMS